MKLTDKELIEQLQERLDNSNRSRAEAISLAIRKQARAEKAEAERDALILALTTCPIEQVATEARSAIDRIKEGKL